MKLQITAAAHILVFNNPSCQNGDVQENKKKTC